MFNFLMPRATAYKHITVLQKLNREVVIMSQEALIDSATLRMYIQDHYHTEKIRVTDRALGEKSVSNMSNNMSK